MRILVRVVRRAPFLLGIGFGGVIATLVGLILALQGTINASALYIGLAPEVRIWDRHGLAVPKDWELITLPDYRFRSGRDVYIETAEVRIYYAGTPEAPFMFAVQPKTEPFPASEQRAPAYDPGPISLSFPNNQELTVAFERPGTKARLMIRAQWRGYVLDVMDPQRRPLPLATFLGPWTIHNETGSVAGGATGTGSREVELERARGYVLSSERGEGTGVVSGSRHRLQIRSDPAGLRREAWLQPEDTRTRAFIGVADNHLAGQSVVADPGARLKVDSEAEGRFLLTSLARGKRSDRLLTLRKGSRTLSIEPGLDAIGIVALDGAGSPEGLRSHALSGFAAL